jgi:hypothetical protein
MLFMKVVNIDPQNKPACIKLRTSGGIPDSKAKFLGEWSSLDNSKIFVLLDIEDARDMVKLVAPFQHMVRDELYPVMETEEMLKFLPSVLK